MSLKAGFGSWEVLDDIVVGENFCFINRQLNSAMSTLRCNVFSPIFRMSNAAVCLKSWYR